MELSLQGRGRGPFSIRRLPGRLIAVLTGTVCRASKRSLIVRCAVSGPVPCSGARRRGKGLDEVSTAIHGDAVAVNRRVKRWCFCRPLERLARFINSTHHIFILESSLLSDL